MKVESAAKIKYGIWGLIGGAVIAMIRLDDRRHCPREHPESGRGEPGSNLRRPIREATQS